MRTIVWFRGNDLRLADHEPLARALAGGEVIPLLVLDPHFFTSERALQLPHRMQFLLDSLHALAAAIAARGSQLVVVRGKSAELVPRLARTWKADRVVAQRWVEPFARERERRIVSALGSRVAPAWLHSGVRSLGLDELQHEAIAGTAASLGGHR